jgi:ParB-like chromosome segregation protein Spo0J
MNTAKGYNTFLRLKEHGLDPLTPEERRIRWLPIKDLTVLPELFQPRHNIEETAKSGQQVKKLRIRLKDHRGLPAISVIRVQGAWIVIDGHHRLKAFHDTTIHRTKVPVTVSSATTIEEALRQSIDMNSKAQLEFTDQNASEAAWSLVVTDAGATKEQIGMAAAVSTAQVGRMRKALSLARRDHPEWHAEQRTWKDMRLLMERKTLKELATMKDQQAGKFARGLAKYFLGQPKQHPEAFALGLLRYDPAAARAIAEHVLNQTAVEDSTPDF